MKKVTDIRQVKQVAYAFLYLDIEKTSIAPIIVQHPFTNSAIVALREKDDNIRMVNILEDENDYKIWLREKRKLIDDTATVHDIIQLLGNAYKLTFIQFCKDYLSQKDLSVALGSNWSLVEMSNMDTNVSKTQLVSMFAKCIPEHLMDEDDFAIFQELPDTITVYRGVTSFNAKNIRALSWTLKRETADWFAHRYDEDGAVYSAQINKQHIFAYFSGRNEDEIVLDPAHLQNVTVVE